MATFTIAVSLALFLLVTLLAVLGTLLGRMLVRWHWPQLMRIRRITDQEVVLDSTPLTRYAGTYGLRTKTGHARIGALLRDDGRQVTRQVEITHGDILTAREAAYDGDFHATAQEVGPHVQLTIRTPVGPAPAWRFGPEDSDTWILHVHGFLADRNNALRTVAALQEVPATQLVVSYRGDGEGPTVPGNATRLGLDEWADVDAALQYAHDQGARRVVMVGWSMGAAISLLIGERSAHRHVIVGQAFVSPATDWIAAMRTSATRMGIPCPNVLASYAAWFLRSKILSRLTGLRAPIDFDELDWTRPGRVHVPTFVIHSDGDRTIPITATRRFAAAAPGLVTLRESATAAHTWEFNVDFDGNARAVREWVERVLQPDSRPDAG